MKEFFPFKIEKIFSRILALLGSILIILFVTSLVCLIISMISPIKILAVENIGIVSSDFTIYVLIAIFVIFMVVYHEEK